MFPNTCARHGDCLVSLNYSWYEVLETPSRKEVVWSMFEGGGKIRRSFISSICELIEALSRPNNCPSPLIESSDGPEADCNIDRLIVIWDGPATGLRSERSLVGCVISCYRVSHRRDSRCLVGSMAAERVKLEESQSWMWVKVGWGDGFQAFQDRLLWFS